jgi:hypothetical protein
VIKSILGIFDPVLVDTIEWKVSHPLRRYYFNFVERFHGVKSNDGKIWIVLKVSEAIIKTGVFGIPAAMKEYIQGDFVLKAADGA